MQAVHAGKPRADAADAAPARPSNATARLIVRAADLYRAALFRVVNFAGPRFGYAFSTPLARGLYRALVPLRDQTEAHLRQARGWLGGDVDVQRMARDAFLHRVRNFVDLMLAPGRLVPERLNRFGGLLDAKLRADLLAGQKRRQAVLLVTAYYGPFDLLPVLLGAQGLKTAVVYRPHASPAFDRLRQRVRELAGCEMIPIDDALIRVPQILDAGGTVGLVADHPAGSRGFDTTFLGIPTRVPPTVGLLAARHRADVVVAGVRRIERRFRFEIVVTDVMKAAEFHDDPDAVRKITLRTHHGLETLVRGDPEQYNWVQERWETGASRRQ